MDPNLAIAAFWLFLAVVIGSLIWRKALQRREVLLTLRVAIDKGLPLDDQRLQAVLALSSRPRRVSHDFFLVFGVILAAAGLCVATLALQANDRGLLVFVALSAEIMAAALLLLWRLFARRVKRDATTLQ